MGSASGGLHPGALPNPLGLLAGGSASGVCLAGLHPGEGGG